MAVLTLSGVLKRPVSGEVVPNARITFDSVSTSIAVLKGVSSVCKTAADGTYCVDLEYGNYAIQVSWAGQVQQYGSIHIDDTTAIGSLNDLLLQEIIESQLTPEIILEFRHLEQQMREQLAEMEDLNRQAGESAAAAALSAATAADSESNAAASASDAADSATAAAASATAIEGDAELAAQSAADATVSAEAAAISAANAGISERNAAISEDNAALSASEAATSAREASVSEVNAADSARAAALSATTAADSESSAVASAGDAAGSAAAAAASATAIEGDAELAAQSAADAAVSAEAAATSAGEASASEVNAAGSAKAAASSATMAAGSESNAAGSASDAADSATAAAASASGAAGSESNAAGSEAAAGASATNAAASEEAAEGAAERAEAAARSLHGVNWREEYDPAVTYAQYDAVGWLGTSYVALTDTTGNAPSEGSAFWDVLAKGGDTGPVVTDGVSVLGDGAETPLHLPFWDAENRASHIYDMSVPFGPQGDPAVRTISHWDKDLGKLLGFTYPDDGSWGIEPAFFYIFDPLTKKLWVTLWISADLESFYPIKNLNASTAIPELLTHLQESEPSLTKEVLLQRFSEAVSGTSEAVAVGDVIVNRISNGMATRQEPQTLEALDSCRSQFVSFVTWWNHWSESNPSPGNDIIDYGDGVYEMLMPVTGLWGNSFLLKSNNCGRWDEQSRDETQITWVWSQYQPGWQESQIGKTTTTALDSRPTDNHWYRDNSASGASAPDSKILPLAGTKQPGLMYAMKGGDDETDFSDISPALVAVTLDKYQQRPPLNYATGTYNAPYVGGLVFASVASRPQKGAVFAGEDLSTVLISYDPAVPSSLSVVADAGTSYTLPGSYQSLSGGNNTGPAGYAYVSLFVRVA